MIAPSDLLTATQRLLPGRRHPPRSLEEPLHRAARGHGRDVLRLDRSIHHGLGLLDVRRAQKSHRVLHRGPVLVSGRIDDSDTGRVVLAEEV